MLSRIRVRRTHRRSLPVAPSLALLAALALPAAAEVQNLGASRDNTLYEESPGNSCGAGETFTAGRTNNGFLRRAPIRFDVAAAIPAGSTINGVTVTLFVDRTRDTSAKTMTLHRATADWGEATADCDADPGQGAPAAIGDATWSHAFYDTVLWGSAGGDFEVLSSASALVDGRGSYSWSDPTLAADVQAWLDGTSPNLGWVLVGDEAGGNQTTRRFASRENSRASDRPVLTVDFTPPAGAEACCTSEGFCTLEDPLLCTGTVLPGVTSCSPNPCPQPQGACCLPDNTCQVIGQADCADQGGFFNGEGTTCAEVSCTPETLTPFVDELPIPALAMPVAGTLGGEATYELAMSEFQQQLHRDLPPTTVWGYGGSYPGPTIEATSNETVTVKWINNLRDAAGDLRSEHYLPVDLCPHGPNQWGASARLVTHLHGAHVPARFDGNPDYAFMPGTFDTYVYPNTQLPATLWYHDHALGITRLNVYMGLAGFYLVRDAAELSLGLPSGEFEVPLVIQDRQFNEDGSLFYPATLQQTFFGDTTLVNGKVWPFFFVKQGKYRFRVLNGSNSRVYRLSLSDGANFQVIGSDGGLLEAPLTVNEITMAPAERYDLVMDFEGYAPTTEIVLENDAPIAFPNPSNPTEGVIPEVMKFIVTAEPGFTDPLPPVLATIDPIPPAEAVATQTLDLARISTPGGCSSGEWQIDGLHWDDVTEMPVLGTTEIWEFVNPTTLMHPMHMHLVQFQVLERQDLDGSGQPTGTPTPPESWEAGWKDTVMAMPGQVTRVIARFDGYVGLFAYHCHILEHEDHEMMRQFQVTWPPGNCDNDLVCEAGEDCISCADCSIFSGAACGNGLCEAGDGEDCLTCPADCNGRQNGNPGNKFCCGAGGGVNPVDCSDARCTSDGFYCRQARARRACCGDAACEGAEDDQVCAVDCAAGGGCTPTSPDENGPQCSDGLDNDCDGFIDGNDPDCGACTPTENPELTCDDNVDNDCDGLIDGDDPDCAGVCIPDGKEKGGRCSDGLDNDCDGLVDGADPDC